MAKKLLMSNGVALWLAKNTSLSLEQIAEFCNMHPLQINNFRENSSTHGITECNPIDVSLLTLEEIQDCEKDFSMRLKGVPTEQKLRGNAKKSGVLEGAIWIVNKYPDLGITHIAKLLKCSSLVVKSVKNETYKHLEDVIPKNPVSLGLCTQQELDECVLKYLKITLA